MNKVIRSGVSVVLRIFIYYGAAYAISNSKLGKILLVTYPTQKYELKPINLFRHRGWAGRCGPPKRPPLTATMSLIVRNKPPKGTGWEQTSNVAEIVTLIGVGESEAIFHLFLM